MRTPVISSVFVIVAFWVLFTFFYFMLLQTPGGKTPDQLSLNERLSELEKEVFFQTNISKTLKKQFIQVKKVLCFTDIEKNNVKYQDENEDNKNEAVISVLVISCNRIAIKRCLDLLIKYRPSKEQFPIVVSQDCNHQPTSDIIKSYGNEVTHIKHPDQSDIALSVKEKKFKGYYKISRHYKWALHQMFTKFNYESIIIVEDDLEISPDFYQYFLQSYSILQSDPSLWCVSAWNDHGKDNLINKKEPELLYRTDFFPGLGWMITKGLWEELEPKWPKSFWDDWMRIPEQRKDRACIRPEISRTRTFGKVGVSKGLFYEKHLKFMKLNEKKVPFENMDLSYLLKVCTLDNYDEKFVKNVYDSKSVSIQELKNNRLVFDGSVRLTYRTKEQYKKAAKTFGLMDDFKSGVPRAGYRGIVSFMHNDVRVYLAPEANWHGYNTAWS
ncbi:Alpha-1,3-mannosyl-glycoprotein 2-beta-N-acetylglucosaminyltransferase [Nymphon striatum]|nr:Alpha-1,3-mannosyl-glycoprotein 2-beta-N-acetylglucosaminyltransferase [Nymphon striatum]